MARCIYFFVRFILINSQIKSNLLPIGLSYD